MPSHVNEILKTNIYYTSFIKKREMYEIYLTPLSVYSLNTSTKIYRVWCSYLPLSPHWDRMWHNVGFNVGKPRAYTPSNDKKCKDPAKIWLLIPTIWCKGAADSSSFSQGSGTSLYLFSSAPSLSAHRATTESQSAWIQRRINEHQFRW